MFMSHYRIVIAGLILILLVVGDGRTQQLDYPVKQPRHLNTASVQYPPPMCVVSHTVNKFILNVSNVGGLGLDEFFAQTDCLTGELLNRFGTEYPAGSFIQYVRGFGIMFGGTAGNDTLVSFGAEFLPDDQGNGLIRKLSTLDPTSTEFIGATAEEEYLAVYCDTAAVGYSGPLLDFLDHRPHKPLDIKITQRSMAWSFGYAEDFILCDITVKNIGNHNLKNSALSLYLDADVGYRFNTTPYFEDDITGFLSSHNSLLGCQAVDTLNMMWIADNNGDPTQGEFRHRGTERSSTSIMAVRYLGDISTSKDLTYNWWTTDHPRYPSYDFGPRHKANNRDFQTGGIGNPRGDRNWYHVMTNGEIDYDQTHTPKITAWDPVWQLPEWATACSTANGDYDVSALLSIGPYDLPPGAMIKIPFAIIGGENFHTDPNNLDNLPHNPDAYYANLDFTDLVKNATNAEWIYDNPGYDTDGDGYEGEFRVCVIESTENNGQYIVTKADTIWTRGDGVPDWRAAAPPPPPEFWLTPVVNGLRVRLNGTRSEREVDIWLRQRDFEGYRIYLGRDDRKESYSLVASLDHENYDKYVFDFNKVPKPGWDLLDPPFTLDQLQCLYGDSCGDSSFAPLIYTRFSPFYDPGFGDSSYYFKPHDFNTSTFGITTPIKKVYPNALDPDEFPVDSTDRDRFTPEGNLKFYEYEFTIENLLPTIPYYVNVTAFDFGNPKSGLDPMETSITLNAKSGYAYAHDNDTSIATRQVYIYPNPYRIDESYRANGLEGRGQDDMFVDRVRCINFANLPPSCVIRIFSIDGDLVRKIRHDMQATDSNSSHDIWNMITRNGEQPKSGLYYWTVESNNGEVQMGKLVIVM